MVQAIFSAGSDTGVSKMTIDNWYKVFSGVGNPLEPTATLFEERPVEVNVDRAESDAQQVSFAELRYAFKGVVETRGEEKVAKPNSFTVSYQSELLVVILLLFLFELLVSLFGDMWSFYKLGER
jgi:hypothetical protein